MQKNENKLIDFLILDEIRNHGLNSSALIEFLHLKGIIDREEFYKFRDDFAKSLVKKNYPFLDVEHYQEPSDD